MGDREGMENQFLVSQVNEDKCTHCQLCGELIVCLSPEDCIGCQACFHGCPNQARQMVEDKEPRKAILISVNGQEVEVPERITIRRALERVGFSFRVASTEGDLQAPCGTGGCYTCLVLAEGVPTRACASPVSDGMSIETALPEGHPPWWAISGN